MPSHVCPHCFQSFICRSKRRGFAQFLMFPLVGLYPWHCFECGGTFYLKSRGRTPFERAAPVPCCR